MLEKVLSNRFCYAIFWLEKYKYRSFGLIIALIAIGIGLYPECVLAVSLEDQLDAANDIVTSKIKVYGVSGATIAAFIWSMFKGNIKLAGVVMATGVSLALFLGWVDGGMDLS